MNTIFVVGAGTMGSGIAQTAAQAGYTVLLHDVKAEFVERGLTQIKKNLNRMVEKGKLPAEERDRIVGRLIPAPDIARVKEADFCIEAATENMAVKKDLFAKLSGLARPEVILASNTSALSITELAISTNRPDKVIGMHFFNPVPVMGLVEIIKGVATSEDTFARVQDLAKALGKTPVSVNEAPGFVVNRLLIPLINEACYLVMEGVASPEDIDTAMKLGANHPIGPLALGDLIGLDVCLAIMETLHTEFGDSKYRPCPLLRKMVRAGRLGRKSGQGFYAY